MSKVNFVLKENPIKEFSLDYLKDYLESLGISQTDSFMKAPRLEDQELYDGLDNIFEAVESLHTGFQNNKKFFLQVDSDADGYTSGAIFYAFFKKLYPDAQIEFRLHEEKEHGIILDTVPIDADYIIIPDAGSNQFDEQQELSSKGYKVIILDHHKVDNAPTFENVIVVNNQASSEFKNKFLSGAGVVYKTIQAYNKVYSSEFPEMVYEDFADLAALGIIADMMDTKNLDNNYIIFKGLKNIKNPLIRSLLEKQQFSIERSGGDIEDPSKINIAFYIAPLINGMIRFGTQEEKTEFFEGLINYDSEEIVETVYRGQDRKENYYDYLSRIATNVRARQNREKTKCMEFLKNRVETQKLHENQLIIVKVSKDDKVVIPKTITGLVAMELLKEYKKPILVLRPRTNEDGEAVYAGSGRGKANGHFKSLYQLLKDSNLCEYVEGHDMAHGVEIKAENIDKVVDYANKRLSDIEFNVATIEVDYAFTNVNVNQEMIMQFGTIMNIYGNGIPQPKFGFKLKVARGSIRFVGGAGNMLSLQIEGVSFIKFFGCDEIKKKIEDSTSLLFEFTLVGRAQINEYNGRKTPQIIVDEADVEPIDLNYLF